ncbi:MAG: tetratricopeptide repeat protein [Polyangiales bacterium]
MGEHHAERWSAVEEGVELLHEGDVEQAVRELTRVTESDPDNEYAHYFLGSAYFDREEWDRALKCYVRALELAPRYLGAMVGAGHALRMMTRYAQALRMAKQALLISKDDPDVLYLLGVTHFQRGDNEDAKKYFEQFLETSPELEVAYEVRGMIQTLEGDVVPATNEGDGPVEDE